MSAVVSLPLDDLVVIELGNSIAAAWTGRLLADIGARVVRVDDPDDMQLYCREPRVGSEQVSAAWLHLNRNKQSVTCRFASDEGRELLGQLLGRADVLIDGLGLDVLAGLGLPYAHAQEMCTELVIAAITPFG